MNILKKLTYIIIAVFILMFGLLSMSKYEYVKLNQGVFDKKEVLYEYTFFSIGLPKQFMLSSRSYVKNEGNGIIAIELNGKIIDSGDTIVNTNNSIQSQSLIRVRDTKFGLNKIRVIGWIDNGEEFTIASFGILIKWVAIK